jgi:hypothetical protein
VATQLFAVAAGVLLTGAAAWQYSGANGSWQQSVRAEVSYSAAVQEAVRTVYGDEAPAALRLAMDDVTAGELRKLSGGNALAVSQRAATEYAALNLRLAYAAKLPVGLPGGQRYAQPGGGVDVLGRLRDLRAQELDQLRSQGRAPPDPDAARRAGDAYARRAGMLGLLAVLVTIAVALAALVRRQTTPRGKPEQAELVRQPGRSAPGEGRRIASWVLALWTAGLVLPLVQLALGAQEQRAQAASARLAAALSSDIAVSNARAAFGTQARQLPQELSVRATARQLGALDAAPRAAADANAVAGAEERAALAAADIGQAMARAPSAADGLEPRLARGLSSAEQDWQAALREQNGQTELSDLWGSRSNAAVVLIAVLLAVAVAIEVHEPYAQRRGR